MTDRWNAPWSENQVRILNEYQKSGKFHPYTCGCEAEHYGDNILEAKWHGWVCPFPGCDYRQSWARAHA